VAAQSIWAKEWWREELGVEVWGGNGGLGEQGQ